MGSMKCQTWIIGPPRLASTVRASKDVQRRHRLELSYTCLWAHRWKCVLQRIDHAGSQRGIRHAAETGTDIV